MTDINIKLKEKSVGLNTERWQELTKLLSEANSQQKIYIKNTLLEEVN